MANRSSDSDDSTARRVVQGLHKIGIAMKGEALQHSLPSGISPTQAQILGALDRAEREGRRVGELAEELAVTMATVSEALSALERKKLIVRRSSPSDRRVVLIRSTAAGRRAAAASQAWSDVFVSALDQLGPDEQAVFLKAIVKMIRGLQIRGRIPVSRMCVSCRFFRPRVHANAAQPHHCDYVDAAIGDGDLRIHCPEHEAADSAVQLESWERFVD